MRSEHQRVRSFGLPCALLVEFAVVDVHGLVRSTARRGWGWSAQHAGHPAHIQPTKQRSSSGSHSDSWCLLSSCRHGRSLHCQGSATGWVGGWLNLWRLRRHFPALRAARQPHDALRLLLSSVQMQDMLRDAPNPPLSLAQGIVHWQPPGAAAAASVCLPVWPVSLCCASRGGLEAGTTRHTRSPCAMCAPPTPCLL